MLGGEATPVDIIMASAKAAELDLRRAANDTTLVEAVRLLAMMPQAATSGDFETGLRSIGVEVPNNPSLFDLTGAAGVALQVHRQGSNDFSEIVRRAFHSTLTEAIGNRLPGLFETNVDDLRIAVAELARPNAFSAVARSFFSNVVGGSLLYYLSRVLSAHVGPDRRFADAGSRADFDQSLNTYSYEASRIFKEFAGQWYSKAIFEHGFVDHQRAQAFAGYAFTKLREELSRKSALDA